jgi:hypothetical protein
MMSKTDVTAPSRLLAVEILLAEPELLGNDALETDLYILRENLRTTLCPTYEPTAIKERRHDEPT